MAATEPFSAFSSGMSQTMSVPADIQVIAEGEDRSSGRTAREGRVLGGCDTITTIEELLTRSRP